MSKSEGSLLWMSLATSQTISSVDLAPEPDARDYKVARGRKRSDHVNFSEYLTREAHLNYY